MIIESFLVAAQADVTEGLLQARDAGWEWLPPPEEAMSPICFGLTARLEPGDPDRGDVRFSLTLMIDDMVAAEEDIYLPVGPDVRQGRVRKWNWFFVLELPLIPGTVANVSIAHGASAQSVVFEVLPAIPDDASSLLGPAN